MEVISLGLNILGICLEDFIVRCRRKQRYEKCLEVNGDHVEKWTRFVGN